MVEAPSFQVGTKLAPLILGFRNDVLFQIFEKYATYISKNVNNSIQFFI
jgi:hypothetical protein